MPGVTSPPGPTHKPPISVHKNVGPAECLSRDELERVRRRDPEAMAAFFDFYFERVYRLVSRLVGERTAAEDITQEIFLKVHRAAHQLDPSRDPAPWLTAIAYNACRDLWRSSAYRMARHSGSIEGDPGFSARLTRGTNDPEHEVLADERRRLVIGAIERLPEPLRVAILMYDYQGLSHQEIARLTGINHAAARKRHSRALEALGKLLRETLR